MLMSEAKDKRTWKCSFTVFPSSALKYAVSIASTQPGTGERPSCYGVHRQTSHSTRGVHSICCRCQKPHHDGWWVRVVTSKCSLPCAVMHGGLVGSQSAPAVICINNLLWRAIPPLMRRGALLYFTLLLRLIIWKLLRRRGVLSAALSLEHQPSALVTLQSSACLSKSNALSNHRLDFLYPTCHRNINSYI